MSGALWAVFAIGLRHGADPDHLAAIDNLTRNAAETMPRSSRFVGTLFALGHALMVIALAACAGALGGRVAHVSSTLERIGAFGGIVVLVLMVALNLASLRSTGAAPSLRARLLPSVLRDARHPAMAIPTGMLFGLGFETSTQLLAYGLAFSGAQAVDGLAVGGVFCFGMICTDTFDSLFVARFVTGSAPRARAGRHAWILVTTAIALVVAANEALDLAGLHAPIDELTLSALTVIALLLTAAVTALRRSSSRRLS